MVAGSTSTFGFCHCSSSRGFSRNITLSVTGFNLRNVQHFKWSSTLRFKDGLRIKHCYWPRTKAKQKFIDFGWKIEVDTKTAGLLFRLTGLDCWWLNADSNFIYHKETRYDTPKTKNGTKKFTQLRFWVHWFHQFEVGTHISCLILNRSNHSTLLPFLFHLKILLFYL